MRRQTRRDAEFARKYAIESRTGRVYTRSMLLSASVRAHLVRGLGLTRSDLASVVDDEDWFKHRCGGGVLSQVIRDVAQEAFARLSMAKRSTKQENV